MIYDYSKEGRHPKQYNFKNQKKESKKKKKEKKVSN
jgi:hypothetical protein